MEKRRVHSYQIKSFTEYLEIIEDFADHDLLLFRGQPCDKPLLPKIARLHSEVDEIEKFESKIFNEFKRKCLRYLSNTVSSDWDLLAIAQHYKLPTRLLDWTENPLTALWFACERDIPNTESGVVWMFFVPEEDIIGINSKQLPFDGQATKVFKPNHITERITSQAGWFTVHKYIKSQGKFITLETHKKYWSYLTKVIVPPSLFSECRVKLNMMGINNSTIFPDLEGLCRHIEWSNLKRERY